MKRKTAVLSLLLFIICMIPFYTGAAEEEKVKVAVINYPNYIQMQADGSVFGYAYEYLEDIRQYTGWEYAYIEMSFAEAMQAVIDGEIDILAGCQYTEERAGLCDFSERDMGQGGTVLCVLPGNTKYAFNDYASYEGIRIAALKGTVRIEQTRKKLAEYGVQVEMVEYETDAEGKRALENGEVDAIMMSSIRCESSYKIFARINAAPQYFMMNRHNPAIKQGVDAAQEAIRLNNPYYEMELDQKYYGHMLGQLSFSQREMEYIRDSGPITVAMYEDMEPIEYYDKSTGEYCGIVPDLMALISEYTGLQFQMVPRKSCEQMKQDMTDGNLQAIAWVAKADNIAEGIGVRLTESHYGVTISVVCDKKVKNYLDKDNTVAILEGSSFLPVVMEGLGYTKFIYEDSLEKCVQAVKRGKADLVMAPTYAIDRILSHAYYKNLNTFILPNSEYDFGIGVAAMEDERLLSILTKAVNYVTEDTKTKIIMDNLQKSREKYTIKDFVYENSIAILLTIILCMLVVLIISYHMAVRRKRINDALEQAMEKARTADKAKSDFLAKMSHDIRTPMNAVIGMSNLAMEDVNDPEKMTDYLNKISASGEFLLNLVNDVLDMARIEEASMELHPVRYTYEEFESILYTMFQPACKEKNITFTISGNNPNVAVMADKVRLNQIFFNLISNSVKFTPRGGTVSFYIRNQKRQAGIQPCDFEVSDNGIGMSEEFQRRMFEPFAQESNAVTKELQGSGLGLPIAANLVKLMGGTMRIESTEGTGTSIYIHIDFQVAEGENHEEIQEEKEAPNMEILQGKRILLVEDHPLNTELSRKLLLKAGCLVDHAENGKAAVASFQKAPCYYYDAVLMDIRMPVMNGLEAAREIRKLPREDAAGIPIVAMTANAFEEDRQKSIAAGMNEHLTKPIVPGQMYRTLIRLLESVIPHI